MSSPIGQIEDGDYKLRGVSLSQLAEEGDFVSAMWLAWTGKIPDKKVHALLSSCLVACVDHGEGPPSAQVTRITASCGKPLADSLAAGLLTFGPRHGNAGSAASQVLRDLHADPGTLSERVSALMTSMGRMPGFGHPEYDIDPRAQVLLARAKKMLKDTPHCDLAVQVSQELSKIKSKPLPLNIDGALGAIMADLDAPAELTDALFIVGRTVGLIAHAREEAGLSKSYRRGK